MSNITIIGSGNVGGPLAEVSRAQGHTVENVTSGTDIAEGARHIVGADIVVLATPFEAALELQREWADALSGKIVIDATNPLTSDFSALTIGFTTSGAEEVAKVLAGARVVKALNAVLAPNHNPTSFSDGSVFVPVAGDDEAAVNAVVKYLASLGFDAVAAGPLQNARYIEPMAELLVQLAYFRGAGTAISLSLQRA